MIDFEKIKEGAQFLPNDQYDKYWLEFNKKKIGAKKLEFLQSYAFIDGNEDFTNHNYDKFADFLVDFYKNAWGGSEKVKRLRYVEFPLDEYVKLEYYTYLMSELNGQEVRVCKNRELLPKKVYDFVLFENSYLFLLDFGNNDRWKGAWLVRDKAKIKEVERWFDSVFASSSNFKEIMSPDQNIIKPLTKKLGFKI